MDVDRIGERNDLPVDAEAAGRVERALLAENAQLRAALADARARADEAIEQQRVIAIENARLSAETRQSLDQQQASAEVLGAIKGSLGDAAPVLERIVESCGRLFAGRIVGLNRIDDADGMLRLGVYHGPGREDLQQIYPLPLELTSGSAIAILERRVVHYPDVEGDDVPPATKIGCRAIGIKSVLFAPLLWQGRALGAIYVGRDVVRPFSDPEIGLLSTFADQAAIAIENGRMFNEVTRRNADLAEALAQQTATAEVLHVISSSPSDVQPVFDAIAERAIALCGARIGGVTRYDGELVHLVSFKAPQAADGIFGRFPMKPSRDGLTTRAVLEGQPVQVPDVLDDPDYALAPESLAAGFRAGLAVPMIRDGQVVGAIGVCREEPGVFPDKQVRLLQTFADQAVIAIENVRLFNETRDALERQTATADILRVISSSPTSTTPVFEAIATSARNLCHATTANVVTFDGTLLHLAARSIYPPDGTDTAHEVFPRPLGEDTAAGRAIRTRSIAMIRDVLEDPLYAARHVAQARRSRSFLGVPLLREGTPIGAIVVGRPEVGAFPDKQISLLQTFADQAVIAIENVRLFNETNEALEQQTATGQILASMSESMSDTHAVFDAIATNLLRLFGTQFAMVGLARDGKVEVEAFRGTPGSERILDAYPLAIDERTHIGRTMQRGEVSQIVPIVGNPEVPPLTQEFARRYGYNAQIGAPMLRGGRVIGAIVTARADPVRFNDKQVALIASFADQAVIAIENVRLFNETKDALERQTATADILRAISSSPTSTKPVFEAILESSARLCEADMGLVLRYENGTFQTIATLVPDPAFDEYLHKPIVAGPLTGLGRVARTKAAVHIPDLVDDIAYRERDPLRMRSVELGGVRTWLGMPMLRDGNLIGTIAIYRKEVRPFEPRQIEVLRTFADQAVIAIENVRLFNATQEALETQTATAEVLRVISQSPTDVQPVFEAIAAHAKVLCGAVISAVARYDGEWVHLVAYHGVSPEADVEMRAAFPMRPGRGSVLARAVAKRGPAQIVDVSADPDYGVKGPARRAGYRSTLAVPMIKDGAVIGAIAASRAETGSFPDRFIRLLQTFADQAVIAIENTRLFNETQEALQTQTATADILKVISESPTDVEPVFHAIAERANVLCNAIVTGVFLFDGEWVSLVGHYGISAPVDTEMVNAFPMRASGESVAARAIRDRAPVQVADVAADPTYGIKEAARQAGYRSNLGVPMLKEGQVVGSIVVCRAEPGTFPEQQIRLLQTFADQAVIAIENVRLFNELREKSEQLERASRHKSEFLANMSHELRTPLNAIIGFTRIVMRRSKEAIEAKQYENLEKILQSGQNLLALINSILDLAKVEAGRVEVHPGDVTLPSLLADCARTIEPLLDESAVKLVRDFDAAPATLFTDEEKLRQIVINLLSNAAKFTPKGSITIGAMQRDGTVTIAVRDTGIGIPADKLELVFEEFEQAGRTGADMQRGTGLGLTISRRLARLMGGDITADSTLGAGSTFTLTLPLRYAVPA